MYIFWYSQFERLQTISKPMYGVDDTQLNSLPVGVFVPHVTIACRSFANQLCVQPFAHTNAFYNSFVPSTLFGTLYHPL